MDTLNHLERKVLVWAQKFGGWSSEQSAERSDAFTREARLAQPWICWSRKTTHLPKGNHPKARETDHPQQIIRFFQSCHSPTRRCECLRPNACARMPAPECLRPKAHECHRSIRGRPRPVPGALAGAPEPILQRHVAGDRKDRAGRFRAGRFRARPNLRRPGKTMKKDGIEVGFCSVKSCVDSEYSLLNGGPGSLGCSQRGKCFFESKIT